MPPAKVWIHFFPKTQTANYSTVFSQSFWSPCFEHPPATVSLPFERPGTGHGKRRHQTDRKDCAGAAAQGRDCSGRPGGWWHAWKSPKFSVGPR